eukprot:m.117908 g.117908  ORF g.117908 m.117908 type:complete len:236 (-) comp51985_c0_seq1:230-937(-)
MEETVVLAFADVAGAGVRALLAPHAPAEIHTHTALGSVLRTSEQRETQPLEIQHFPQNKVSTVVLNTVLEQEDVATVLFFLLDLFSESQVKRIVIVCGLRLKVKGVADGNVYVLNPDGLAFFFFFPFRCRGTHSDLVTRADTLRHLPALPAGIPLNDSLLSQLIQLLMVERIPWSVLATPAYPITSARERDSSEVCYALPDSKLLSITTITPLVLLLSGGPRFADSTPISFRTVL